MRNSTTPMISNGGLRRLLASVRETDYLIVDVREEEEYEVRHLSGAMHFPLIKLFIDPTALPTKSHTILYCSTGRRSSLAATTLGPHLVTGQRLYVLEHGLMGWDGGKIAEIPNLRVFDLDAPLRDLIVQAINLEKGAYRLYTAFAEFFDGHPEETAIREMIDVEDEHARMLYAVATMLDGPRLPTFEVLFEELSGELLEGGQTYADAVRAATASPEHGGHALIEICLQMELKAYDLYRSLANSLAGTDEEELLLDLAQQERGHAQLLASSLRP